jgi:DNA-cytosine methyltransferase
LKKRKNNKIQMLNEIRFLSLFAGIGGFDLGLERAGMKCVGQVENNKFCLKILEKHWQKVKRIKEIKNVNGNEFGTVDLICGGFPCQPFSVTGKQEGKTDDRYLWPEMFRVIKAVKPTWVVGENVFGIIGLALDDVLSDLEGEGYEVKTFIIPACAVGAWHRRDRVWIIAYSTDNGRNRYDQGSIQAREILQNKIQSGSRRAGRIEGCGNDVSVALGDGLQRFGETRETERPAGLRSGKGCDEKQTVSNTKTERFRRRNMSRNCGNESENKQGRNETFKYGGVLGI